MFHNYKWSNPFPYPSNNEIPKNEFQFVAVVLSLYSKKSFIRLEYNGRWVVGNQHHHHLQGTMTFTILQVLKVLQSKARSINLNSPKQIMSYFYHGSSASTNGMGGNGGGDGGTEKETL